MGALSTAEKNRLLNATAGHTTATATDMWVQLHTGSPGAAGTNNVSTAGVRIQAIFGNAASGGTISNTGTVTFPAISVTPAVETLTHVSVWSASSGGDFKGADAISFVADIEDGDDLIFLVGSITLSLDGTLP